MTKDTQLPLERDWTHAVSSIPDGGLDAERRATPAQLAAIAAALDIMSVESISARYRIESSGKGRYRLEGDLRARVVQACVVTLDPVAEDLAEAFAVDFWPAGTIPDRGETEQNALDEDPPEPLENGRIPVGRIVFETLAASLDPFPRAPGAELELPEDAAEPPEKASPFAALAKLRTRQGNDGEEK